MPTNTMRMEMVAWGDTQSYMATVNEKCALREPIDTRSNLNNRDKQTVRSYKVLDGEGKLVGGFTLRCNCWYLAEVKYIHAEDKTVLAFILAYALKLAKRPMYQITTAATETVLRKALAEADFKPVDSFKYKDRTVGLWSKPVDMRSGANSVSNLDLLPEEEAAALIEAPKPGKLEGGKAAKSFEFKPEKSATKATDTAEFDPKDDSTWPGGRMYPDEKRKTPKVHKHGDFSWHSVSMKHKSE